MFCSLLHFIWHAQPFMALEKHSGSCFTKFLEHVQPFTFTRISCCLPLNQLTCKLFTFLFHFLNDVFFFAETSVYKLVQVLPSLSSLQHTTDRATGSPKARSLNWAHKLRGGLTIQNASRALNWWYRETFLRASDYVRECSENELFSPVKCPNLVKALYVRGFWS